MSLRIARIWTRIAGESNLLKRRRGRRDVLVDRNREVRPEELLAAGWTRLAASAEIGRTVLVRHVSCDGRSRTVLLWRTRAHQPIAMDSMCPHRPYSMAGARLVGDALECPIHLRLFGPTGLCVNRPQGKPAQIIDVREVAGYLWLVPPQTATQRPA